MPSNAKTLLTIFVFSGILLAGEAHVRKAMADEFWAIPQLNGKGDDYLFKVQENNLEALYQNQIRCEKSFPTLIYEFDKLVSRTDAVMLIRVACDMPRDANGEVRTANLKVLCVTVVPKESVRLVVSANKWEPPNQSPPEIKITNKPPSKPVLPTTSRFSRFLKEASEGDAVR